MTLFFQDFAQKLQEKIFKKWGWACVDPSNKQCIKYLQLHNKFPPSEQRERTVSNFLKVSVEQESRCSLSGILWFKVFPKSAI